MRILIHDFAGHPFQVQLSRELSARGHRVIHSYSSGLPGPKGKLQADVSDSSNFHLFPIPLSSGFRKYSPMRRLIAHRQYARKLKRLIAANNIEVVLSGNTPIDIQAELLWYCKAHSIGFGHWVQDVYCQAIKFFLSRSSLLLGKICSYPFLLLEKNVVTHSSFTVAISPAFLNLFKAWGLPTSRSTVIKNWAPLDEMPTLPRNNRWSQDHGLNHKIVFLYSGTLGLKHRPDLLLSLADHLGGSCQVVVITEGVGRHYLEQRPRANLTLLPFQSYDRLAEVLATADVLVATLDSNAAEFAVPSKLLTYLCAGRPILLGAPKANLASSVLIESGAGLSVDPSNEDMWIRAAQSLMSHPLRKQLGINGRAFAEANFDIRQITSNFERLLSEALRATKSLPSAAIQANN